MVGITISSLVSYFSGEEKSIKRGENHYKSDHVLTFSYSSGVMMGKVKASMKDTVYKTTLSPVFVCVGFGCKSPFIFIKFKMFPPCMNYISIF